MSDTILKIYKMSLPLYNVLVFVPAATFVGLGGGCTCDIGCDPNQNLICERGECRCLADSVVVNQTCLLSEYRVWQLVMGS